MQRQEELPVSPGQKVPPRATLPNIIWERETCSSHLRADGMERHGKRVDGELQQNLESDGEDIGVEHQFNETEKTIRDETMGVSETAVARELSHPSYEELVYENGRLRAENKKLNQESEQLRAIFRTGVIEFEKRNKRIVELREKLNEARDTIRRLEAEKETMEKRIQEQEAICKMLNKMIFGKKSEQAKPKETSSRRGAVKGHKGYGRKAVKGLEIREEIIDLPEDEKVCAVCGKPYQGTTMEDESEEVCFEKVYYLKKTKRKVYKKTCTCGHLIVTAKLPAKLIPKGKYSIAFWVDALINKFKNHLPVQRQVADMNDYGLHISTGTIFG